MKASAEQEIKKLFDRCPALLPCRESIQSALELMAWCFSHGGKLIACGNGGSAADCQHIVGELMKGFVLPRKLDETWRQRFAAVDAGTAAGLMENLQGALPALSVVGENALATAFANDQSAEYGFAQHVFGSGREGDVLLCLSTSGNSRNVLHAAVTAKAMGLAVVGLTGETGGALGPLCDICIRVPAREAFRVQEYHLPVYHALCLALEEEFFGGTV